MLAWTCFMLEMMIRQPSFQAARAVRIPHIKIIARYEMLGTKPANLKVAYHLTEMQYEQVDTLQRRLFPVDRAQPHYSILCQIDQMPMV